MIAFAFQFAIVGIAGIGIGIWTYKRADELSEANKAVTSRFIPGRIGRAAGAAIGSSTYQVAGLFAIGLGLVACLVSLVS